MYQEISYEILENIPVFKCSFCNNCHCLESKNAFNIHRGCCFYFPKYNLFDIKNLINFNKSFLFKLIQMKNSVIHNFYIEVQGDFDNKKYEDFLKNNTDENLSKYSDFDPKLFFKKCCFVTEHGCKLNFKLRPHQCNLYLCREVIENCNDSYSKYSRERKDYFAYCNFVNMILQGELYKNHVNLKTDLQKSIAILEKTKIDTFDFSKLDKIQISS